METVETVFSAITSPFPLAGLGLATLGVYALYRFLWSPYRFLHCYGVKGPRPLPIFGNFLSIHKIGHDQFIEEQMKNFGQVFGYYIGTAPKVAVTDVEVAKEIMVKEFENFSDRGFMGPPSLSPKALGLQPGMVVSDVETWRPGRRALTPSFSAMKMKLMVPLIKKSTDVLLEIMREFAESGKSVEVFGMYGAFTMETLMATAFGQEVAVQRGEGDQVTKAANTVFRAAEEGSAISLEFLTFILSSFPCFEPLILRAFCKSEAGRAMKLMHETGTNLINARMQNQLSPKVKDLIQLMIDATVDDDSGSCPSGKKLTSEQIAGFSVDFFLAGYETTATTLGFTSYLLAMHTDIQDKLQAEIDEYFEQNPECSLYEAAQKINYLEMVIFESMRLYTPLPKTQRHCCKTVTVGGVTIPEGADAFFPLIIIHHMPQYWPDPYKFDPQRFTAEAKAARPQLAYMPFGWGPRNCIGLRFALMEAKIALMEILRNYSFVRGPETVVNLQPSSGLTLTPKGGVLLNILPRN